LFVCFKGRHQKIELPINRNDTVHVHPEFLAEYRTVARKGTSTIENVIESC
jgi:hypothetical protein